MTFSLVNVPVLVLKWFLSSPLGLNLSCSVPVRVRIVFNIYHIITIEYLLSITPLIIIHTEKTGRQTERETDVLSVVILLITY